jgi:hypothetical protein
MTSFEDDSFMKVLDKKLRALRKKLEKIKSLETSRAEGKTLNEQQEGVLLNKPEVLKFYQEYDGLKEAFLQSKEVPSANPASGSEDPAVLKEAAEDEEKEQAEEAEVESESGATSPKAPSLTLDVSGNVGGSDDVERLLRLLHTVQQCQTLNTPVPAPLYTFSKVLCGATKSPLEVDFAENLAESVEQAGLFLQGSQTEVANGLSYAQLDALVLEMVAEPDVAVAPQAAPAAVAETQVAAEVPQTAAAQPPTTE